MKIVQTIHSLELQLRFMRASFLLKKTRAKLKGSLMCLGFDRISPTSFGSRGLF